MKFKPIKRRAPPLPRHETIGVTGHRPDKLGGYDLDVFFQLSKLAQLVLRQFQPYYVLTGMALGWDQAVAHAANKLGIPFIAYIPFEGQEAQWPSESQERYYSLLQRAYKQIVCTPGPYSPHAMQRRNEMIVEDCDLLLCLWDGSNGGTANCLEYAAMEQRKILNLWKYWESCVSD